MDDENKVYTPEEALDFILNQSLHDMLQTEDIVEGDCIRLPEWNATLKPEVAQLNERGIILNLYLDAPQWGKTLFECSVGMGGKNMKNNIGMATGSFLFSFMQGISAMEAGEGFLPLVSGYAGHAHRWKVYLSNIVGIGKGPEITGTDIYWKELEKDIVKRLGNQRLCYVKIYGAKMGDDVTGECRIDDVKSEELSRCVAEMVRKWKVEGFASQKQFFFIRQEEDTILPNPYEGAEGRELFRSRVITAVKMFHEADTQEKYESLPERLETVLEDSTLANECNSFLPELCAQNAFGEIEYAETIDIRRSGGRTEKVYVSQMADYYPLWNILASAFHDGTFGDAADDIYRKYIGCSATYGVISQMQEKGSRLSDARLTSLCFNVADGFELR